MTLKPLTEKDFEWTSWSVSDIENLPDEIIASKKKIYERVKKVPSSERNFENTIYELERPEEFENHGAFLSFLASVSPDREIRNAAHEALNRLSQMAIDLAYDEDVYIAVLEYSKKRESDLDTASKILLRDTLRGYKRMGFGLSKELRIKVRDINKKLSLLANDFEKNLNEYNDFISLEENEVDGLPDDYLNGLSRDKDGRYLVTLKNPDRIPFQKYSKNEEKRKELAEKSYREGGEKNIDILKEAISLRDQLANILGYESFPHFALETEMAKSPDKVFAFLEDLREKLLAKALEEKSELEKIKGSELLFYDMAFYSERHKEQNLHLDGEKVKEYFPVEKVMDGMFLIYEELLGVSFRQTDKFPAWHESIQYYEVLEDNKVIALFATDLYPREGKYGHYAMMSLIKGLQYGYKGGEYQTPFSVIVGNFPTPTKYRPSLLSHQEVETVFHEFGHVMHSVLTRAKYGSQSGTRVAGDFVEAPSQMLEYWVWDSDMIKKMSGHYKTGEALPEEILENLIKSKKHLINLFYLRQNNLALFDMRIHSEKGREPSELYREIAESSLGIKLPKDQIWPASFPHIMGGYESGYYGYLWSEVVAADMFSLFKENGLLDKKTGRRYKQWILEKGGSLAEDYILKSFLGREPSKDPFLEDLGIK